MIRRAFLLLAFAGAVVQAAPPLEIVGAEFGLFVADRPGELPLRPPPSFHSARDSVMASTGHRCPRAFWGG